VPSLQQVYWQRDYMTVVKDAKKFANKHPLVATLFLASTAFTAYYYFYSSYVITKAFQRRNQ